MSSYFPVKGVSCCYQSQKQSGYKFIFQFLLGFTFIYIYYVFVPLYDNRIQNSRVNNLKVSKERNPIFNEIGQEQYVLDRKNETLNIVKRHIEALKIMLYLTIILQNRTEYRLIFRKIDQDNCFII